MYLKEDFQDDEFEYEAINEPDPELMRPLYDDKNNLAGYSIEKDGFLLGDKDVEVYDTERNFIGSKQIHEDGILYTETRRDAEGKITGSETREAWMGDTLDERLGVDINRYNAESKLTETESIDYRSDSHKIQKFDAEGNVAETVEYYQKGEELIYKTPNNEDEYTSEINRRIDKYERKQALYQRKMDLYEKKMEQKTKIREIKKRIASRPNDALAEKAESLEGIEGTARTPVAKSIMQEKLKRSL